MALWFMVSLDKLHKCNHASTFMNTDPMHPSFITYILRRLCFVLFLVTTFCHCHRVLNNSHIIIYLLTQYTLYIFSALVMTKAIHLYAAPMFSFDVVWTGVLPWSWKVYVTKQIKKFGSNKTIFNYTCLIWKLHGQQTKV